MLTIKQLNAKIEVIGKATGKWRDAVQEILVDCAEHAFAHKNVDPFTKLVGHLKGSDLQTVANWIKTNAPGIWVKSDLKFRFNKAFDGEFDREFLLGVKWYDKAQSEKTLSDQFDVLKAAQDLLKRVSKAKDPKNTKIQKIVHPELEMQLRRAITQYEESVKSEKIIIDVEDYETVEKIQRIAETSALIQKTAA